MDFRIPAESAAEALLAFSRQANLDVLFPFDELAPARSHALKGAQEPAAALARLLQGTGFVARATAAGKFVVTPAGGIAGRLLAPDRVGARGIRVAIVGTGETARTDDNGDFSFPALAPGVYRLIATGGGFEPLQLPETKVEARRIAALPPQMLQTANDLIRLEAVVVEGQSDQVGRPDAGQSGSANRTAGGDLDLPRTPDDALEYEVYTRDQITRSGTVNLDEFLQRELLDSEADTQDLGTGGPAGLFSGSSNLNLRGYGTDETVILVNGRRLPDILTGGVEPWTAAPDVDLIPVSLVERIEVLPLSASALYNGNPVGGVINIVLRSDADTNTTEVTTTYTNALRRFDAPETSLSILQSPVPGPGQGAPAPRRELHRFDAADRAGAGLSPGQPRDRRRRRARRSSAPRRMFPASPTRSPGSCRRSLDPAPRRSRRWLPVPTAPGAWPRSPAARASAISISTPASGACRPRPTAWATPMGSASGGRFFLARPTGTPRPGSRSARTARTRGR